jgi:branched-chain amino acid aminotransferase
VVQENGFKYVYLLPLAFRDAGPLQIIGFKLGIDSLIWSGPPTSAQVRWNSVDVGISSWNRPGPNTIPQGEKAGGNYLSGQLSTMEAERLSTTRGSRSRSRGPCRRDRGRTSSSSAAGSS